MKIISKSIRYACILIFIITFSRCESECANSERCRLEPDAGPCLAAMPKYYYDKKEKRCKEFTYGGCQGVVPFETLEECKQCECN